MTDKRSLEPDRTRERGKIRKVSVEENHGFKTVWCSIEFGCAVQGFGGLALQKWDGDDNAGGLVFEAYARDLCAAFGVRQLEDLEGKECFALRCFDTWNEPIEGLESVETGRRFLHSVWRRTQFGSGPTPLEDKIESLESAARSGERRAAEARNALKTVRARYVDWENT